MPEPSQPTPFPGWPEVSPRGAGEPRILLLLDFDGTLAEIVESHETAVLREGNTRTLEKLSRKPGLTVGVLSGRSLNDVAQRVGLRSLVYAGNHGMEIQGPGFEYLHPGVAAALPGITKTASRLNGALAGIPGAHVENKGLTLTVHYRQTPPDRHEQVQTMARAIMQDAVSDGRCRITTAKCALELRPSVDWHKGRALEFIRSQLDPLAMPIYIGDDRTDEDAFQAAQVAGGFGVFVGPVGAETCAQYHLESPAAVSVALADLASG